MPQINLPKTSFTKDFDGWNEYKKKLEVRKSPLWRYNQQKDRYYYDFYPREVWYCSIGVNIGVEICGKNEDFERPVLILKKSGRLFICLPMTSKKPSNENLYFDLSFTDDSGSLVESYVTITNSVSLDVNRLLRRVRKISPEKFSNLLQKHVEFLQNYPKTIPPIKGGLRVQNG